MDRRTALWIALAFLGGIAIGFLAHRLYLAREASRYAEMLAREIIP